MNLENVPQSLVFHELCKDEIMQISGGINFKKALELALDIITIIAVVCPRPPHHPSDPKA